MLSTVPFQIVFILLLFSINALAQTETVTLEVGKPIERELKGGESHSYRISLASGQFLNLVAEQKGIDVVLNLFTPDGKKLLEIDSPNGNSGTEPMFFVAESNGDYRLEISSLEKSAKPGRYEVKIAELRTATPKDIQKVKAKTLFAEAIKIESARTDKAYLAAIEKLNEAVELFRAADDSDGEYDSLYEIGQIYGIVFQDNPKAIEYFDKSAAVAEKQGNKLRFANAIRQSGICYISDGDFDKGLILVERAYTIYEAQNRKFPMWDLLNRTGNTLYVQGNYPKALEYHFRALEIGKTIPNFRNLVTTLHRIGLVYSVQDNYVKGLEYDLKALEQYELLSNDGGIGAISINIGKLYAFQGNLDVALTYFQKALEKFNKSEPPNDRPGTGTALIEIGEIYRLKGNYAEALKYSQEALTVLKNTKTSVNNRIVETFMLIGKIHREQGNYAEAQQSFQKALELETTIPRRTIVLDKLNLAEILNDIAEVYFLQGNYTQSLDFATQANEFAKKRGILGKLWQSQLNIGKAFYALNQKDKARKSFEDAVEAINKMRSQVAGGEQEQQSFLEGKSSPFYEMVKLLQGQGKSTEALNYAESFKARVLLDVLQNGRIDFTKAMSVQEKEQEKLLRDEIISLNAQLSRERNNARQSDLQSKLNKKRLEFEDFQTRLYASKPELKVQRGEMKPVSLEESAKLLKDEKSALLEYVVADDKTFLFVITKDASAKVSLKVYPIELKQKDLAARTESFRLKLAKGDLDFSKSAQDLYNLLLKPAEAQLKNKTNLIIVPDNALWDLPFQSLQNAQNKYLIESSAISYAPSLTALSEMIKKNQGKNFTGATLLAFGNPTVNKETSERVKRVFMNNSLESLPEAERLVTSLGKLYGASRSKIFIRDEAREEIAKTESSKYRIIQFAAHGILNDISPMYSHIVLSQKADNPNEDGLLEAWEMKDLDLNADMVILSACETARGRVSSGEGVIGMSWALFIAGTPTTVATQWKVESSSTTELMMEFHRQLLNGKNITKSEALRRASLKLMKSAKYKHPSYWAGFVIVGDGF